MANKNDAYYFDTFSACADFACEAAAKLNECLASYTPKNAQQQVAELHAIEHAADMRKHEMMSRLVRAFITPIEREDIIELSRTIDGVTDAIEDIMIHIYMTAVPAIRPDCLPFAALIGKCCAAMKTMLDELPNFRKSKTLPACFVEINSLEEEGDRLYMELMRKLHSEETDPLTVMAWREIYGYFEKVCDACEDVADIAEGIAIGNT